ncbi:MAG: cell division protein FtsQ, partial [Propionibacterium sp.]|nr:cell division protein FtsQ [Propionibacterium sp.]
ALPDTAAERAESVTTRGPDAIVIHLTEGVTVEWGSAERSADKALVLSSLMTAVPDAKVYNVSAPDHPATR